MYNKNKKLNKKNKKVYIEETLKKRSYFSYRIDLVVIKIVLVCLFFMVIYSKTKDFRLSSLISLQLFILITLVNVKILNNRAIKGKDILFKKIKRNKFEEKLKEMNIKRFGEYIKLILEKSGFKKIVEINKKNYSGYFNGNKVFIRIFYMYSDVNIDSRDIRDIVIESIDEEYKHVVIATPNNISKDTYDMINNLKKEVIIDVFDLERLYSITNKLKILKVDDKEYNTIIESKVKDNKNKIIKTNVFGISKIIIYALSAVFFYLTGKISYLHVYNTYISYYFIILLILSIGYNLYSGTFFKKRNNN